MKSTITKTALLALATFGFCMEAPAQKKKLPADLQKVSGKWTLPSDKDGEKGGVWLEIDGEKITISLIQGEGKQPLISGTLKIDETSLPKQFEIISDKGLVKKLPGIYQLYADTLVVSVRVVSNERPKEFFFLRNQKEFPPTLIFKRVKTQDKK